MTWQTGEVIFVSFNNDQIPDLQLIFEPTYKDIALISVNLSCTNSVDVANFVLSAMFITNVGTAEPFYITNDGHIKFGNEAYLAQNNDQIKQSGVDPVYH